MSNDPIPSTTYPRLNAELRTCLDRLTALWPTARAASQRLAVKLAEERFNLVALGQFKRGKTSLINALLGDDLLPVGVLPLTSVSTEVRHGPTLTIEVRFQDGRRLAIDRAALAEYATEVGNPRNRLGVRDIHISHPAAFLSLGLRLVDTPGIGSIHDHNTATARALLPRCDAALFLLSADQPASREELAFLAEVRDHAQRIFCVLNKIDILNADELDAMLAFTRAALGEDYPLFPVSARWALRGRGWADPGCRQQSRLPPFIEALGEFLHHGKGRALLLAASRDALALAQQAHLECQLERQGLAMTPAAITQRLAAFQTRRDQLSAQREALAQDYYDRTRRLVPTRLDPALRDWRERLTQNLRADWELGAATPREPRALDAYLSALIAERLEAATATLLADLGPRLADALAGAGREFLAQIEADSAALRSFAADLCALEAPTPVIAAAWTPEPGPLVSEAEPSGLDWLATALVVRDIPSGLQQRWPQLGAVLAAWIRRGIVRRRWRDALAALDQRSGQLRYGLLQGLMREQARQHAQGLERYAAAAAGIAAALQAGRVASQQMAAAVAEREAELIEREASLVKLQADIDAIRQAAHKI